MANYAIPYNAHTEHNKIIILDIVKFLKRDGYDVTCDSWSVDAIGKRSSKLSSICLITGSEIIIKTYGPKIVCIMINGYVTRV